MADGEEKAIFVGVRNDLQETLPGAAKHASSFADDTAGRMDAALGRHAENEAAQEQNLTALGKRPAEEPQEVRPAKAPKTNSNTGEVPQGDVTDAGVTSGGASSAESGPTDPVDVVSGQLLETVIDFSLPGVLPLVLRRAYTSGYRHGALFGPGWSSTADIRMLVAGDGAVRFLGDDAQVLDFGVPAGLGLGLPAYPGHGARWALTREHSGALMVTDLGAGISYLFGAVGEVRLLEAIRDRVGNEIRFARDDTGLPVAIDHSGGYRIAVSLIETSAGPRIGAYTLEHPQQDPGLLVGFDYDEAGRLVRVLDSTAAAHCYEWDEHDRIRAWIDKAGYRYPYRYDAEGRVVEAGEAGGFKHALLAYDRAARVTTVTDGVGARWRYHYDRYQQITKIVDPSGAETVLRKDSYGRLLSQTSALGHTMAFDYDATGNRTRITYPDGNTVTMAYHAPGLVSRVELPGGVVWRYTYDEHGNLLTEQDPLGALTAFSYDEHGAVVELVDPLGAVQRYENNPAGLPIAATDPSGVRTQIERDAHGRIAAVTRPDGAVSRLERDSEGRVIARIAPDGSRIEFAYDLCGNQVATVDASGAISRVEYGPFHRPTARVNPDGARYEFAYDAELRLTQVTGPTGLTWTYQFDQVGNRVAERDFNGRTLTYTYDPDQRVTAYTGADGSVVAYERDFAGRLLELRAGEEVSRFGYDAVGRLTSAVNSTAAVSIIRDAIGQPIAEEVDGRRLTRTFDLAGNLIERTTPSGRHSVWTYDVNGDAAGLRVGAETVTITRDILGREIRREFGAEVSVTQSFDANDELTGQRILAADQLVQERRYGYDPDGFPVRIGDLLRGVRELGIDQAGRITEVTGADWNEIYLYDQLGNISQADAPRLPHPQAETVSLGAREIRGTRTERAGRTTFTYDAADRLTTKTRRTLSGQQLRWHFTWDAQDRLTGTTTPDGTRWAYSYDALGRRTTKTRLDADGSPAETTWFTWDGVCLAEQTTRTEGGATTLTWDYEPDSHVPAAQRRLTEAPNTGTAGSRDIEQAQIDEKFWAIVTDLTGTAQELITPDGTIAWAPRRLLWGRGIGSAVPTRSAAGSAADAECPLGFPGQYLDDETGLAYNNQRYYDPETATYLSPDPKGLDASPNPHRYVTNPLTVTDPLGLTPQTPNPPLKTDDELQADADALWKTIPDRYNDRAGNGATVSTFQGDDGGLYYTVNNNQTNPDMRDLAKELGYKRIAGAKYKGPNQTDAEQLMLNAVDKGDVPNAGRIATSRVPCQEFRPNNPTKKAQNCAARLASYLPKIRLVGRYG
ncbi:RHS repeat protein [Actinospica sp. MGRD01-02]|uniref:RHS repeat protein n=1 Tax=Actinospica acidithermotolerans TaxID=2828514 RepID=A0A941ECY3_9ACTN|nr:RHS repeat-associated core domain-containing protein [Actinospica acidithermotolerans]MBR7828168.1 RHS repeat protein [Actinospica acidithermotolerans]